jgi:hypothetical protein
MLADAVVAVGVEDSPVLAVVSDDFDLEGNTNGER